MLKRLKEHPIQLPTDRKFGVFFAFVFTAVAIYITVFHGFGIAAFLAFLAALGFAIAAFVRPGLLQPLNKSWAYLGLILGMIISPIVLGIIYFGLFTPIAAFLRIKGRDELRLKNKALDSNWIVRDPVGPEPESFKNQF